MGYIIRVEDCDLYVSNARFEYDSSVSHRIKGEITLNDNRTKSLIIEDEKMIEFLLDLMNKKSNMKFISEMY